MDLVPSGSIDGHIGRGRRQLGGPPWVGHARLGDGWLAGYSPLDACGNDGDSDAGSEVVVSEQSDRLVGVVLGPQLDDRPRLGHAHTQAGQTNVGTHSVSHRLPRLAERKPTREHSLLDRCVGDERPDLHLLSIRRVAGNEHVHGSFLFCGPLLAEPEPGNLLSSLLLGSL